MNYCKVVLGGRLTRDPEVRYTPKGVAVCNLQIAYNRTWTADGEKKDEVNFIPVVAFGKTAEVIGEHFKKGKPILLDGRLKQESWEKDGEKKSRLIVNLDSFTFVESRKSAENGSAKSKPEPEPEQPELAGTGGKDDDDVPF